MFHLAIFLVPNELIKVQRKDWKSERREDLEKDQVKGRH